MCCILIQSTIEPPSFKGIWKKAGSNVRRMLESDPLSVLFFPLASSVFGSLRKLLFHFPPVFPLSLFRSNNTRKSTEPSITTHSAPFLLKNALLENFPQNNIYIFQNYNFHFAIFHLTYLRRLTRLWRCRNQLLLCWRILASLLGCLYQVLLS